MELWQLNTFITVARTLHFTRASEELNLTQPAVSNQIQKLEKALGVKLFLRDRRKILLSPQGKIVLEYAHQIIDEMSKMKREVESKILSEENTVSLALISRSFNKVFIETRRRFLKENSDKELYLHSVSGAKELVERIKKGKSDLGIFSQKDDYQGLDTIPFGIFEMILVVGKNHHLSNRKQVEFKELENEKWLLFNEESSLRKTSEELFKTYKFEPKSPYVTHDGSIISNLVQNGEGIAFLPKWAIIEDLKEKSLIHVEIKNAVLRVPSVIVYSKNNASKSVEIFIDFLLNNHIEGIYSYKTLQV